MRPPASMSRGGGRGGRGFGGRGGGRSFGGRGGGRGRGRDEGPPDMVVGECLSSNEISPESRKNLF